MMIRFAGCRSVAAALMIGFLSAATLRAEDAPAAIAAPPAEYAAVAEKILAAAKDGTEASRKLEYLCDRIGPRLSGSPELEKAIAWAVEEMQKDGLVNVKAEPVMVPKWVRGKEWARMVAPREAELRMLGLGGSIATPAEGITADVLVVPSVEELRAMGPGAAKGKIVVFNYAMPKYDEKTGSGYGRTVRYRSNGATWAAEAGAVACLVRSVTAAAIASPHTGAMRYGDDPKIPRIPAAAITIEDAEMMARLQSRGVPVRVTLYMEAKDMGMAPSANVVAELRGREKPDEIVILSGHYDSWDVGHGAHDDGGPSIAAWEAVALLKRLGLQPRRTIRVVLWTNEENGLKGALTYEKDHEAELSKTVAAIEGDSGVFAPQGFSLQMPAPANEDEPGIAVIAGSTSAPVAKPAEGTPHPAGTGHTHDEPPRRPETMKNPKTDAAKAQLTSLLSAIKPIGATAVSVGYSGADIGGLAKHGVVCFGLDVEGSRYFDFHHCANDTFDKVDTKDLNDCVAALAYLSYVLADLETPLGR